MVGGHWSACNDQCNISHRTMTTDHRPLIICHFRELTMQKLLRCIVLLLVVASTAAAEDAAKIYQDSCASCHDTGANRAPTRDTLRQMQPDRVLAALESGAM